VSHPLVSIVIDELAAFDTSMGNGTEVVGVEEGSGLGTSLGPGEGISLGIGDGRSLGAGEGSVEGPGDGSSEGVGDGEAVWFGCGKSGATATTRPAESVVTANIARDFTTAPFAFGTPSCARPFFVGTLLGESVLQAATPRMARVAVADKIEGK
jgi:hypothetical protein